MKRGPITPKPARCKHCRKRLERIGQKLHDDCVAPWWAANGEKVRIKAERVSTRARKEKIKRLPDLIAEAQREFNAYIRERDSGQPCICCGKHGGEEAHTGGKWDAGHYRSTGSASHLRFDERNVHRQLKDCNRWGAGRAVDYRIGLIARIGLAQVEALEADNAVHKWQADELRAIRDTYRKKTREMKAANQAERVPA